jgi:hypothetical protein
VVKGAVEKCLSLFYPMRTLPAEPRIFEFSFPRLDTLLKVEVWSEGVSIRASRNSFDAERKVFFIQELAAEGFIPDEYRWFALAGAESPYRGVRWTVDPALLGNIEAHAERTRRIAARLSISAAFMMAFLEALVSTGRIGNGRFEAGAQRPNELVGGRGQHYVESTS